jgi:P-type conjugative transfer protein TrbJ
MHPHDIRRSLLGAAGVAALAQLVRPAAAQIPVFDLGRFTTMLLELEKMKLLYDQLTNGVNALQNAARRLPGLPGSLDDALLSYRTLTDDVNSIGYRIETITRQYKRVFPDEQAARDTTPEDVSRLSETWDQELYMSSLAASRSQATLSTIESNTRNSQAILARSGGETSQVGQLQALVHMIEVVNSDLEKLSVTLAATDRVNASLAATQASSREVMEDRRRQMLEGYVVPVQSEGLTQDFLKAE